MEMSVRATKCETNAEQDWQINEKINLLCSKNSNSS